jgi:hypothetical protein
MTRITQIYYHLRCGRACAEASNCVTSKHMKKPIRYLFIILVVVGILFLGFKKNIRLDNMQVHETEHFTVYYEALGQETVNDIAERLETSYPAIRDFFGLGQDQKGRIVVYASVGRFQRAYLGLFLSLLYGDWAAGAAYRDLVLITSPENPGTQHTYEDILDIVVHEYVHTLVYGQNEMPDIWLDEGLATFLAGQKSELPPTIPAFEAMQKKGMAAFLENDGYAFSYVYVEYLVGEYGNERVVSLARTNDYEETFGKTALDVYNEWVLYLKAEYYR